MSTFTVRIKGTINDVVEVEAEGEQEAMELALVQWQYVEFEDLDAVSAWERET